MYIIFVLVKKYNRGERKMTKRKLKPFVLPTIYALSVIMLVLSMYLIQSIISNSMFDANEMKNEIEYVDGEITDVQCQHCLSATNLGNQYVFVTGKALSQLQILRHCYLAPDEKKYYLSHRREESRIGNDKVKIARKQYRGQGEYIEDILK